MLNDRDTMLQVSLKAAATAAAFGENVLEFGGKRQRSSRDIRPGRTRNSKQPVRREPVCQEVIFPFPAFIVDMSKRKMLMGVASPIVVRQNSIKAPLLENRFLFAVCPARMENADTLKCDDDR